MWPPSTAAANKSTTTAISSSTSKSKPPSSTCLCPPPFSLTSPIQTTSIPRKSMDEVWKGINLSSLPHHPTTAAAGDNHRSLNGLNLQNISPRPPLKDPQTGGGSRDPFSARCAGFGSLPPPAPAPAPVTALSLSSSGSEIQFLESSDRSSRNQGNGGADPDLSFLSSLNSPFEALSSPTAVFHTFCKKRASENDENSGNFRHKRMIKNRESAARSRARKQAYANGLENEVARLLDENARLRRQLLKFCSPAPPADQLPKKKTLQRTLTAPF